MIVLLFLLAGLLLGFVLRGRPFVQRTAEQATIIAIYALLFLLGLSVGASELIMGALKQLGLQALLLSSGSILGSLALVGLLYVAFFRPAGDG